MISEVWVFYWRLTDDKSSFTNHYQKYQVLERTAFIWDKSFEGTWSWTLVKPGSKWSVHVIVAYPWNGRLRKSWTVDLLIPMAVHYRKSRQPRGPSLFDRQFLSLFISVFWTTQFIYKNFSVNFGLDSYRFNISSKNRVYLCRYLYFDA